MLATSLLVAWLLATAWAFWWFQFRHIQAFDGNAEASRLVFFEAGQLGDRLQQMVAGGKSTNQVTVVHFWNPGCACNRFNEAHVQQLIEKYADRRVRFIVVVYGRDEVERKQNQLRARQVFNHAAVVDIRSDWQLHAGPGSSPAVAVLDAGGVLTYFGPYSLGAVCSVKNGGFVEAVLDTLSVKGKQQKYLNLMATGCFCDWQAG